MRLKNIFIILKDNMIFEDFRGQQNGQEVTIQNWDNYFRSLKVLHEIECLSKYIDNIYNISPQVTSNQSRIVLTTSQYNDLIGKIRQLHDKILAIVELCESMGYDTNPNGFDVKIPESEDFEEYVSNLNVFRQFLTMCPYIKNDEATIHMERTDVGSDWIQFAIIATSASTAITTILMNLGKVVEEALKIRSLYLQCESQKEIVRTAKTQNDLLDKITKLYDELIDQSAKNSTEALMQQMDSQLEPEDIEKSNQSIKRLGKLMSKGLEIYSAIEAPKEVQAMFPTVEEQKQLGAPKKQIRAKAESLDDEKSPD